MKTKQPEIVDVEIDNMISDLLSRKATPGDMSNFIDYLLTKQADTSYEQGRSECPCLDKYKLTNKK